VAGVAPAFVAPLLAFNYAVWKYRKPAHASRAHRDSNWLVNRITDIARAALLSCKPKASKANAVDLLFLSNEHAERLCSVSTFDAIAYTDGSAMPNPGPAGAGATIFLPARELLIDTGVPLGTASNNFAEIVALIICISELIKAHVSAPLRKACVFSDSSYAISMAASNRRPWANIDSIDFLRRVVLHAQRLFHLELHWVKGHADVPGNERADAISKHFSRMSASASVMWTLGTCFNYFSSVSAWPYGPPGSAIAPHLYNFTASVPGSPVGVAASQPTRKRPPPTAVEGLAPVRRSARLLA
jgi:ribonuclease HI